MKEWKTIGIQTLKLLYDYDYKLLDNVIKLNNKSNDFLIEDDVCGYIKIYNKKYKKRA